MCNLTGIMAAMADRKVGFMTQEAIGRHSSLSQSGAVFFHFHCVVYLTSLWLTWNPIKKGRRLMFVARNHSLPELDLRLEKKKRRKSAPYCPAIMAKYGPGQLENIRTTPVLCWEGITIRHRVTTIGSKCVLLHSIYNCLNTCFP